LAHITAPFQSTNQLRCVPNVQKWLDGEKNPTVKQLEDFSKKVHLPFGYLFLSEPPQEDIPIPYFRTNNANTTNVSVNVYDTILLMQQRQDWLRNYLKDSGFQELPFVGTFANSDDIKSIANDRCYTVNELVNAARQYGGYKMALIRKVAI